MRKPFRAALLFVLIQPASAAPPNQFVARYLPIGPSGSTSLLAADTDGDLFIVGTVTEPSGRPQIRAIKTDPQGNELASFDFGGSGSDVPSGAAVDPQGNLVIVGTTDSQDFPLVLPLISSTRTQAGFVVKLDSQLKTIRFATLLAGAQGSSSANAAALDSAGDIYVAGSTSAADFPTTAAAAQTAGPQATGFGTPVYAFVTQLSPNGDAIVYSTFYGSPNTNCVGGSGCIGKFGDTSATAIAVDGLGDVVVAGATTANQLPVTSPISQQCGCMVSNDSYSQSAFLVKFAPGWKAAGSTYIVLQPSASQVQFYSTISITSVAMDAQGNVVFAGSAADGLVITKGALQPTYPGGTPPPVQSTAGFAAKVNSSITAYLFSTYFGADITFGSPTGVSALALDAQGDIWLTGGSAPAALPILSSIPQLGSTYVAELSPDGSSVLSAITAPAGAAGQALVLTPSGVPAVLGPTGSLLLSLPDQRASLVGIANSAGVQVAGEVAPFELVSLYGVGLGPSTALSGQVVNGALTNSLGGVQVLFNNVAAPLLYAGPNQINAIVPSSVSGQNTATVQVLTPNGTLAGPLLSVVSSEPEVFQNGPPAPMGGLAIALNQDGSLNSAANPAAGGSIVTVWATGGGNQYGVGNQDGVVATNEWAPMLPVSIVYSNAAGFDSLAVLYAGSAPGFVTGVLQVNFQLPAIEEYTGNQLTCQLQVGAALSGRFAVYVKP